MTIAEGPPDWSTRTAELACPLCDYNLRGLVEPRCPECGFAFTWEELLDHGRDRHPWLFEHAPRGRRRRAFASTYLRTCMPRRFWREVTPTNPVRRGPLINYWIVTTLLLSGAILGPLLVEAGRLGFQNQQIRAMIYQVPGRPGFYTRAGYRGPPVSTVQLNAALPRPWTLAFARDIADLYLRHTGGAFVAAIVVAAAWPWLSSAALLVFRASMRRAKVDANHILRATIYSCDCGLLITVASIAACWPMLNGRTVRGHQVFELAAVIAVLTAGLCAVVATYRLTIAYGRYLRFHLPLATVLTSQVIVFLILVVIAIRVAQGW